MRSTHFLECFSRRARSRIDVRMSAQLFRQRWFVAAAADGNSTESHLAGVLDSEMSQTSNALDRDEIAAPSPCVSQRVVNRDASTKQRHCFVGWQVLGHESDRFAVRDHVLGVSTVEVDRRDLLKLAVEEITSAARIAFEAVSAVPAYAHALARLPEGDIGTRLHRCGRRSGVLEREDIGCRENVPL